MFPALGTADSAAIESMEYHGGRLAYLDTEGCLPNAPTDWSDVQCGGAFVFTFAWLVFFRVMELIICWFLAARVKAATMKIAC